MHELASISSHAEMHIPIFYGDCCFTEFVTCLKPLAPIGELLIVTDENVDKLYAQSLQTQLEDHGYVVAKHVLRPGRKEKSLASVENILKLLFERGADRNSLIVNVGGGVVGDIGGLAAALYLRGIRYIHMPTTLLSQVDSSIGGKVGVNYLDHLNGIGRIYYPAAVWIDLALLDSLPDTELIAGLAEVVKYAAILDKPFFSYLEQNTLSIRCRDRYVLEHVVRHAVQAKAAIVAADPAEKHDFKLFTYGHEIGHALEILCHYEGLRHGEAVAIGMQGSAWLSEHMGLMRGHALLQRQTDLLRSLGLPIGLSAHLLSDYPTIGSLLAAILRAIGKDKKRENQRPVWVLPTDIGQGVCTDQLSTELVTHSITFLLGVQD